MEKEDRRMLLEEKNMLLMEDSFLKAASGNLLHICCPSFFQEELASLRGFLISAEFVPENPPILSSWNSFVGNNNFFHRGEELLNNHLKPSGPRGLMCGMEFMPENTLVTDTLGSFAGNNMYYQGEEPVNNHSESSDLRGLINTMEFVPETPSDMREEPFNYNSEPSSPRGLMKSMQSMPEHPSNASTSGSFVADNIYHQDGNPDAEVPCSGSLQDIFNLPPPSLNNLPWD